jgi:ATP-dependent Clp protease adapter protein ClpS
MLTVVPKHLLDIWLVVDFIKTVSFQVTTLQKELTMTPERAKELLPIITAFSEGKSIEWQAAAGGDYVRVKEIDFNKSGKYRIKEETIPYRRFIFVNPNGDNEVAITGTSTRFTTEEIEKDKCFVRWIDHNWIREAVNISTIG